jgi:very-long-chain enoyl-CoA reductase
VAILVTFLHYFRRLMEVNFLHNYSEETLPWIAPVGLMLYYWFLWGYLVMYYLLRPGYTPWYLLTDWQSLALGALFLLFEILNFRCHRIVAGLRKPGTNERGIP